MREEFEILGEDLSGFHFIEGEAKPEWSATWTRIRTQSTLVVRRSAQPSFVTVAPAQSTLLYRSRPGSNRLLCVE